MMGGKNDVGGNGMNSKVRRIMLIAVLVAAIGAASVGGIKWYDSHVDRSGWVETENGRFYQDFHGEKVNGWLELPEGTYYFEEGVPRKGWFQDGEFRYQLGEDGRMTTGFWEEAGKTYYFGGNGHMLVGWLWLAEDRYYFADGVMVTGWQTVDGQRMYFNEDGIQQFGFQTIGGLRCYLDDDGVLATGETVIEGETYLFGQNGDMFTGWEELEGGRRYYRPEGPRAVGFLDMEDGRRYFDENGLMVTGWHTLGEDTYYFDENGIAATGPVQIEGQLHYFSPKGVEVILVNALNPIPSYFEQTLTHVVDYHDVDSRCYDALIRMLSDCEAAGIEYIFNSAYRTLDEQTAILEIRTQEHMKKFGLTFAEGREMALETVAIPNTSEHQLGLSVDLLGEEAIPWFQEHCWDYGFILRYPEGKEEITGITDESWHFRYVGTTVSLDMKDTGLCLEEYLGAESVTSQRKKEAALAYMERSGEEWKNE